MDCRVKASTGPILLKKGCETLDCPVVVWLFVNNADGFDDFMVAVNAFHAGVFC